MVNMFLTAAIIQARMYSKRFPRKVMQEIKRNSLLEIKIESLKLCNNSKGIITAIPLNKSK